MTVKLFTISRIRKTYSVQQWSICQQLISDHFGHYEQSIPANIKLKDNKKKNRIS